jgi:chromosome segregation ATPase
MNKQRRSAIAKLMQELSTVSEQYTALLGRVEDIKSQLETLHDEEDEAYQNMPESLQQSDKGQVSDQAVSSLEDVLGQLSDLTDGDNPFDEAITRLESIE